LVETFFGGLLGHEARADQVVERETALLGGELRGSLAADSLDVELIEVAADGGAVHGRYRRRDIAGGRRGLRLAGAERGERGRVARAVVDDLERARRERALERGPHLHHDRFAHTLASVQPPSQAPGRAAMRARASHSSCRVMPAKVSSVSPNILKLTQARSLAL